MKRLVCLLMVVSMLMLCAFPAISENGLDESAKLTEELKTALQGMEMEEETEVYIFLSDIDENEVMADFERRFPEEFAEYVFAKEGEITEAGQVDGELLQSAIERKRAMFAEKYLENNEAFIKEHAETGKQIFVSRFSPMIIAKVSKATIIELINNDSVAWMDLFIDAEGEAELANANNMSGAKKVRDTFSCKGAGVKIGQIEYDGLPDVSNTDLANATITVLGNGPYTTHATRVARIMIGQANGIAPQASLYAAKFTTVSSFYVVVEWLIEQGVNVINMSAGRSVDGGLYDNECKWVDHIAIMHDVHFVKSAGNRGEGDELITSPGMAYNAITVGGFYDDNNTDPSDDVRFSSSSYKEVASVNRAEKPNLIADAKEVYVGVNSTGTSFAAPQVTGVIAQLCGFNSALKVRQTEMGAILTAGAAYKLEGTVQGHSYCNFITSVRVESNKQISVFEGAGKLNAEKAYSIASYHNHWKATVNASSFPYTKTVYITQSSTTPVRVAIFWLKRNSLTGSHILNNLTETDMTNLNLTVKDPNGTVVGSSSTTYSNYEIVQFYPSQTGTYSIIISRTGSSTSEKEYIGIAVLK